MKTCFKCNNYLYKNRVSAGLVSECSRCRGVWVDAKNVSARQNFSLHLDDAEEKNSDTGYKCNNCERVLRAVGKESTLTRNRFIAKVYRLFLLSLITGALGAGAGAFFKLGYTYFWGLFAVEIAILFWTLAIRKNKKWNMLALFSFTTFGGLAVSPLLNGAIEEGQGVLIPIAFGLTVVLFGVLIYYVHKTKKDFSFMGGFLMSALWVVVIAGILGLFMPGLINILIYCSLGVLLFSGFVLYDTSRVILKYDVTEYVSATLDLYLDFLNIFFDILRILVGTRGVGDFSDSV